MPANNGEAEKKDVYIQLWFPSEARWNEFLSLCLLVICLTFWLAYDTKKNDKTVGNPSVLRQKI